MPEQEQIISKAPSFSDLQEKATQFKYKGYGKYIAYNEEGYPLGEITKEQLISLVAPKDNPKEERYVEKSIDSVGLVSYEFFPPYNGMAIAKHLGSDMWMLLDENNQDRIRANTKYVSDLLDKYNYFEDEDENEEEQQTCATVEYNGVPTIVSGTWPLLDGYSKNYKIDSPIIDTITGKIEKDISDWDEGKDKEESETITLEVNKEDVIVHEFVNSPKHYNAMGKEVFDMMIDVWGKDNFIKFCEMNAFKYRMRAGLKPGQPVSQDIEKAMYYEAKANKMKEDNNNTSVIREVLEGVSDAIMAYFDEEE